MGKPRYTLVLEETPNPEDVQAVRDALTTFNTDAVGPDNHLPLALFVRDRHGQIVGGLLGDTFWGWLHIEILWVDDTLRGQGFGGDLLAAAEREALRRGCHAAFVDTMSFQAPGFYERHGYTLFGKLDDFPVGYTRHYYAKRLRQMNGSELEQK